jgi:hypothetical protein
MKEKHMVRVRLIVCVLAALLAGSTARAQVQAGAPSESLAEALLKQAQTALDAFDRPNAEKFARQVLEQMSTSTASQKEKARIILANVFYPEEAPAARKRPQALAVLREAVRENYDLTIDRLLSWPGLDSILVEAKAATFGVTAAAVSQQQDAVGPAGHVDFTVRASKPAIYSVTVTGPQTSMVIADSTGSREATLSIPTMRNERPLFTSGDYQIVLTARDRATGDSSVSRFAATVVAPELTFASIPSAIDSSKILAERTKKYGFKGVVVGGLVAGSIFAFATKLHADTLLRSKAGPDAKGTGVAAVAGAAIVIASFADKGRSIPSAIVANQRLHDDLATSIRNVHAANANRIATHKTIFVITPGGK